MGIVTVSKHLLPSEKIASGASDVAEEPFLSKNPLFLHALFRIRNIEAAALSFVINKHHLQ